MKKRQYRSNQGRTPKQMEGSYKMTLFSIIGLILTLIYIIIDGNS